MSELEDVTESVPQDVEPVNVDPEPEPVQEFTTYNVVDSEGNTIGTTTSPYITISNGIPPFTSISSTTTIKAGPGVTGEELLKAEVHKDQLVPEPEPEPVTASVRDEKKRVYRLPKGVRNEALKSLRKDPKISTEHAAFARKLIDSESIDIATVEKIAEVLSNETDDFVRGFYGGDAAMRWTQKVTNKHQVVVASAAPYNEDAVYLALQDDLEEEPAGVALFMIVGEDEIYEYSNGEWILADLPEGEFIELDEEALNAFTNWLESNSEIEGAEVDSSFLFSSVNPEEYNLFELAHSEIDWEMIDRTVEVLEVAGDLPAWKKYTGPERAQNAKKQVRSAGGKFVGAKAKTPTDEVQGNGQNLVVKATLPTPMEPVADPAGLIQAFLEAAAASPQEEPSGAPQAVTAAISAEQESVLTDWISSVRGDKTTTDPAPTDTTPAATNTSVLYLAIVDPNNHDSVLDLISVVPGPKGQEVSGVTCWKRENHQWVNASEILASIQNGPAPTVVELKDEQMVTAVVDQVDAHDSQASDGQPIAASAAELSIPSANTRKKDASRGYALPDGSYPIRDVADLKKAIQAYGRAPEDKRAQVKAHIKKRAKALGRADLIPDTFSTESEYPHRDYPLYGPNGEIIPLVAAGTPGVADVPSDQAAVARLRRYWMYGEGGKKIRWSENKGNLTRCHKHLSKYLHKPGQAWGFCQSLHMEMYGESNAKKDKESGV